MLGILPSLWSASGHTGAFMRASNVIHGTPEGRPFWKLRPLQILITNVKLRGFESLTPGSLVAIVVWIVASALFGFHVANFGSSDKAYGTLGWRPTTTCSSRSSDPRRP